MIIPKSRMGVLLKIPFLMSFSFSTASYALDTDDFEYIDGADSNDFTVKGKPLATYDISGDLPAGLLSNLYSVLPEGVAISEDIISPSHYTDIHIDDDLGSAPYASAKVTFLGEGAHFRNTLGYFIYETDNPPEDIDDIDAHVVIFPNASKPPIGELTLGSTVDLNVELYPGDSIGFFVIPNGWGWSGQYNEIDSLGYWNTPFYSVPTLNPEYIYRNRYHSIAFADITNELLVFGFEDLLRPSTADNDFNDLLFSVEISPFAAVKGINTDGTTDQRYLLLVDQENPELTTTMVYPSSNSFATLAYEDNWPMLGDYDFNDVVWQYRVRETLNAQRQLVGLIIDYELKSMGAGFHNGFAVHLPNVSPDNIESAHVYKNDSEGTHQVLRKFINETVMIVEPDLKGQLTDNGLIDEDCPYYRTEEDCLESQPTGGMIYQLVVNFDDPVERADIGYPPYDSFIFGKENSYHGDAYPTPPGMAWQTHLKQFSGTEEFNSSLFSMYDDSTTGTHYFVSMNYMPWAINIADVWNHPLEFQDISMAYPYFSQWITSSGINHTMWYKDSHAIPERIVPYE